MECLRILFLLFCWIFGCSLSDLSYSNRVTESCELQLECTQKGSEKNKIRLPIRSSRGPAGPRGPSGLQGPRGYPGPTGAAGETTIIVKENQGNKVKKIAFFAGLKENVVNEPLKNENVVFDLLITNVGETYNNNTGEFTAPVSGVYIFSVTISAQGGTKAAVRLIQDMKHVLDIWSSSYPWATSTAQAILEVKKNSRVWLQYREQAHFLHGYMYSTFSGYLLFETP